MDLASDLLHLESKYGGLEVSAAMRLKAPDEENCKLKKLLAEEVMVNAASKEMLRKDIRRPAREKQP